MTEPVKYFQRHILLSISALVVEILLSLAAAWFMTIVLDWFKQSFKFFIHF